MSDPAPSPRILSAGIDWITATAKTGARGKLLEAVGRRAIESAAIPDEDVKRWYWQGYEGLQCGRVQAGTRADGSILRIHGSLADFWHREAQRSADKLTRLDLQVTVALAGAAEHPGRMHLAQAMRHREQLQRPPTLTHIDSTSGGYTLYVGSRASDQVGRIYDKGAQDPGRYPAGTWRYEVELHRQLATSAGDHLMHAPDRTGTVASTVHVWYRRRGIVPSFNPGGAMPIGEADPPTRTDATRLAWLRSSVRPVIRRLADRVSMADIYAALDLLPPDRASEER